MKSKLFLIALLLATAFGFAQEVAVSGTVSEAATGLPIPGANVAVKNSTIGTITDMDGNFTLSVPQGSVIQFSYMGFMTQEVPAAESMTISLAEDVQTLDQVVIIGYGTQKKKEVTGAVSVVSSETIDKLRPVKVEQALQGTVSGVNVTAGSGSPGATINIRIRGIGTNGNPDPSVIVDGYILSNPEDLGLMNPNDIESITVLKDAQAAIYGTIGANGVILVTTKKGRKNSKTAFSYNTYTGFQETTRKLNLLNATEYALLLNESYANGGQALPFPDVSGLGKGTDWQEEVFRDQVPIISHDLSISGGSEKISYMLSGSHLDQDGILAPGDKSNFRRNTARLALNVDLTDKLKVNTNLIYTQFSRRAFNENVLGSVLFNAINIPGIYSPYDENGEFTVLPTGSASIPGSNLGNEIINPLAQIDNTYQRYNFKRISGTVGIDYEIIKDLVFTNRIGFGSQNARQKIFNKQVSYGGKVFDTPRSSVNQNAFQDNDYTYDMFFNYRKSFTDTHNFTGTLGLTANKQWGESVFATGFDIPNNSWENADIRLANGLAVAKNVGSGSYDERLFSYYGRLQYDYKGRYLISGMIRRDSSTKFGPDNRVAWFPSVTGGWIISEESFYGTSKTINFAKLRASYGVLGSERILNNLYVGLLDGEGTYVFDNQLVNGVAMSALPNGGLKWEEARKFDVGLDLQFLDNKFELIADYFIDRRENLLISGIPISGTSGVYAPGAMGPTINAGGVENKGFEISLSYKDRIGEDFNISANYNITMLKNNVYEVNNGTGIIEGGGFGVGQPAITRMEVGQPLGYFYGYQTDGIFQNQAEVDAHPSQVALGAEAQPGDIRYRDVNGDDQITVADKTNLGDPIPDATMGFNLQLDYKGFDFAAYSYASLGNDMVRNYERTLNDVNRSNYVLDRWHGEGTSNKVPRVTTAGTSNNVFSDYFVEDASFLRIQNVQLGYTINPDFTKKAGITRLRFYAAVNNLYTFTKYRGYDPSATMEEPLNMGIDYGFYPVPRTYMIGLNLNF